MEYRELNTKLVRMNEQTRSSIYGCLGGSAHNDAGDFDARSSRFLLLHHAGEHVAERNNISGEPVLDAGRSDSFALNRSGVVGLCDVKSTRWLSKHFRRDWTKEAKKPGSRLRTDGTSLYALD